MAAPLWVAYPANLGTLLRTCDAVGACLALPATRHYRAAVQVGNTLREDACIHWVQGDRYRWVADQQAKGTQIVGVELAEGALSLASVVPATQRTVVCLGHEHFGLPDEVWPLLDTVIEIPMVGSGHSLNVAVSGSLVLYKLAGLL
jgi:tRNA (guanosine-2'-O-)-methyltransferase